MTGICLATEDLVTEKVLHRLVEEYAPSCRITRSLRKNGAGYLKKSLHKFNQVAENVQPVVILTDLDTCDCAPTLLQRWQGRTRLSTRLLIRVAVREVESWGEEKVSGTLLRRKGVS